MSTRKSFLDFLEKVLLNLFLQFGTQIPSTVRSGVIWDASFRFISHRSIPKDQNFTTRVRTVTVVFTFAILL